MWRLLGDPGAQHEAFGCHIAGRATGVLVGDLHRIALHLLRLPEVTDLDVEGGIQHLRVDKPSNTMESHVKPMEDHVKPMENHVKPMENR